MSKTITINIPVEMPDGWEYAGEYRQVQYGEHYVDRYGRMQEWDNHHSTSGMSYAIIRKIAPTPWNPVKGERAWALWPNGTWGAVAFTAAYRMEYNHGTLYPESTTEAQREAITARVHALHMEIHAERDGVAR